MRPNNSNVLAILQEAGRATASEIRAFFPEASRREVSRVINQLRCRGQQRNPKQIHIKGWTRDDPEGVGRRYPRPIYAPGDGPDAPKPKPQPSYVNTRNHRAKLRAIRQEPKQRRITCVWDLGIYAAP